MRQALVLARSSAGPVGGDHAPDSPELAERAAAWRGAYLHVPFCARVCPYCDFAVVEGGGPWVDRYLAALHTEIDREPPFGAIEALFVGGGTPTRLPAAELGRLVGHVRGRFGLAPEAEVTVEANPEDWTPALALGLVEAGFTRASFGVQSFDSSLLAALGRRHTPAQAAAAVSQARRAGFRSINLDLIFGTPEETPTSWRRTVDRALSLQPDHLSTYALTVERGTPMARAVAAGSPAPDPDRQADLYEESRELLAAAGLIQYEVSNFARAGHACRYNLLTWAQGEYLGLGLGAHAHRNGVRRWNLRRLDAYVERLERDEAPEGGRERLDRWGREQERLLLGLRRRVGVKGGWAGARLLQAAGGRRLLESGLLVLRRGRLVVTEPLLTDLVSREVLALDP